MTFTISSGVQLTVKGDIQINAGTTINNYGTIDLTGNWINMNSAAVFNASSGTVILNGTNQTIGGASPTDFYNLDLHGGTKTLLADASSGSGSAAGNPPAGVLSVNDAVFDLNTQTFSVYNPDPPGVTRTTGYILSEDADNSSRFWWASIGPGVHTIPFGNNAGEDVSFSFTCSPAPGTTSGSVRAATYPTAADNTPYPFTPVSVTNVNNATGADNSANLVDRFWYIEKVGTADYYFRYAPSENAAGGNANMRAQYWNAAGAYWEPSLPGQTNPSSQQVYVPSVPASNPFMLEGAAWAIGLESSPLPVELLYFNAQPSGPKQVTCSWSTLSEINNDFFVVEKSRDGIQFVEAGTVDGAGNSTSVLSYAFTDENPYPGLSYYRLRQLDFDGASKHSQIVPVQLKNDITFLVYPNPVSDLLFIQGGTENESGRYALKDPLGKTVLEIPAAGTSLHAVSVKDLAAGIYFVEIDTGERILSKKIQVVR